MKRNVRETIKTILQRVLLPLAYRTAPKKREDKPLVLFSDCHHAQCPYSMRRLYDAMKEDARYTVEGIFRDYGKGSFYALRESVRFMRRYAAAQAVVICDNHLPVASAKKRQGTFVTQLWHSGGALKKFGYDSEINVPGAYRGGNIFGNYDLVTVSAPYAVPAFQSAMRIGEHSIRAIGTARSDYMFDRAYQERIRTRFFETHPQYRNKKIVLYAPTFRGSAADPVTVGFEDVSEVREALMDSYAIIRKPHPHDRHYSTIRDAAFSAEELLVVCDLLITDYSSIIYDYSILCKPLLLYIPDYEDYRENYGFYEDFDKIPAVKVFTKANLRDSIVDAVCGFDAGKAEEMRCFAERTMASCDGHAAERIKEEIERHIL